MTIRARRIGVIAMSSLLAVTNTQAQAVTISGRVTNDTGGPIPSALVMPGWDGLGGLTTGDGRYSFVIPDGRAMKTMRLIARHSGYRASVAPVNLAGTHITQDFVLIAKPQRVDSIGARDSTCALISYPSAAASNGIIRAFGLESLRDGPHRDIEKEIRIWRSVAIGYPDAFYRIVSRGGRVSGQSYRYLQWRDSTDRGFNRPISRNMAHEMCTTFEIGVMFTCHTRLTTRVDWSTLWKRLELMGVWTIPDQALSDYPYVPTLDGDIMTVELWDGHCYRVWTYRSPNELSDTAGVEAVLTSIR